MHVDFATLQLVGFITLFTYYSLELIHFYWIRDHEADEREEEERALKIMRSTPLPYDNVNKVV